MAAKTKGQTDTAALRAMWNRSATDTAKKLRSPLGEADDITKLQTALEAIEGREELDRLNAMTRRA